MNHDIAHCQGNNCPIKETCDRYKAHLEVIEGKYQSMRISYFRRDYLCDKAKKAMEE